MTGSTDPKPATLRPGVATLRCPNCGGTVAIRAPGQTVSVVCQSCASVLDVEGTDVANIVKYVKLRARPLLAMGSRGTFRGQLFEVIGFITQNEDGYTWDEYLLFNPRIGFRWLVHDHGHWNFVTPIPVQPLSLALLFTTERLEFDERRYRRYHIGKATVHYVEGEFYWRVRRGDASRTCDFIAPPYMLSADVSGKEVTWSRLEYIEPSEIAEAFKVTPPERMTIGANQPDPNLPHSKTARNIGLLALVLAILIQIGFAIESPSREVLRESIPSVTVDKGPVALGPVELKGRSSAMELKSFAPVNNTWLEIQAELVNEQTEASYAFTQSIEQYSGSDSDGSWSEGGPFATSMIASVPPGTYTLLLTPTNSAGGMYPPYTGDISVQLSRNVHSWSAFWVVSFAIWIYPAFVYYRRYRFAVRRWENSEFTPFASGDDD